MTAKATRRTVAKFAVVLLNLAIVVVCLNGVMFISATRLDRNRAWVNHTHRVQLAGRATDEALLDAESSQRAYLLTGRRKFLDGYDRARAEAFRQLDELRALTADNPVQQARTARVRTLLRAKFAFLDGLNADRGRSDRGPAEDDRLDYGHQLLVQIRTLFAAMDRDEEALYAIRDERLSQTIHRIYAGLVAILGKDCIILAVLANASYRAYRLRRAYGRRATRGGPGG